MLRTMKPSPSVVGHEWRTNPRTWEIRKYQLPRVISRKIKGNQKEWIRYSEVAVASGKWECGAGTHSSCGEMRTGNPFLGIKPCRTT